MMQTYRRGPVREKRAGKYPMILQDKHTLEIKVG